MDLTAEQLRSENRRQGLDPSHVPTEPMALFRAWQDQWAGLSPYDPLAAVLATVNVSGEPSARWIDVVHVDEGFVFFTDSGSRKGLDLALNARCALSFGWLEVDRQVNVRGPAAPLSDLDSDGYFCQQPRRQQLLSWATAQSNVLQDKDELITRLRTVQTKFAGQEVPRPLHWSGYRLLADEVEFWQGSADFLHDRVRYRREGTAGGWARDRIAP
jgi:pyridoxamine 5'-phosphate oxidase